jgi:hypothetical protein
MCRPSQTPQSAICQLERKSIEPPQSSFEDPRRRRACQLLFTECCPSLLKPLAAAALASFSSRSAVLRCSSPSPPPRLPASLHGVLSFAAQAPRRRRACQLLFTECCPSLLKPLAAAALASFSSRSAVPRCSSPSPPPRLPASLCGVLSLAAAAPARLSSRSCACSSSPSLLATSCRLHCAFLAEYPTFAARESCVKVLGRLELSSGSATVLPLSRVVLEDRTDFIPVVTEAASSSTRS